MKQYKIQIADPMHTTQINHVQKKSLTFNLLGMKKSNLYVQNPSVFVCSLTFILSITFSLTITSSKPRMSQFKKDAYKCSRAIPSVPPADLQRRLDRGFHVQKMKAEVDCGGYC